MEKIKWYKKENFWAISFTIVLMIVHLFIKNIFIDGISITIWISLLIGVLIRNKTNNIKEKEGIIFSFIMMGNYILFRCGIYIPNYILVFIGLSWMIMKGFNKEDVAYKLQKKILVIILLIGFFSLDYYMNENNIIKDKNFYRSVKKEYKINGNIKEEDLERIEKLSLDEDINSLEGIEYFKNLKSLNISDGVIIYDFKPIGKLSKLDYLTVLNANLDKLEKIDKMESIERIEISYPKRGKINSLDKFPNLKRFDVYGMDLYDLEGFKGPNKLERLDIGSAQVISFDGIENFKELKELNLYELRITDISKILELEHLEKISIQGCDIPNMDEFEENAKKRGIKVEKIKSSNMKYL